MDKNENPLLTLLGGAGSDVEQKKQRRTQLLKATQDQLYDVASLIEVAQELQKKGQYKQADKVMAIVQSVMANNQELIDISKQISRELAE